MSKKIIEIKAKDCSVFSNQEGHEEAIFYFFRAQSKSNLFQFSFNKERLSDDSPIMIFKENKCGEKKWYAGRYVGEASFEFKRKNYKIIIEPRFGNTQLYRMLDEVFHVRISESIQKAEKTEEYSLIQRIVALLWFNMLSRANKHGLPKTNIKQTFIGKKIRGRLNVMETIIPLKTQNKLVSNYWDKIPNESIVKILKQAYYILKKEYKIPYNIKESKAANNALEQLLSIKVSDKIVTENEYNNIFYKNIYKSYKPVVDLSWDIIKRKKFGNNSSDTLGMSPFIDMAEIWEMYLKSILRKKLVTEGWWGRNDVIQTYPKKNFQRKLIPDIVFQKNNTVLVWDAKWKRMTFDNRDYDRSDFFQIHTYINYFEKDRQEVIIGGLLYPLSKKFDEKTAQKNYSNSLYGKDKNKTQFMVDGVDLSEIFEDGETDVNKIKKQENEFLNRIIKKINTKVLS